jgi:hypothetical protein
MKPSIDLRKEKNIDHLEQLLRKETEALIDADLTLRGLLEEKKIRPESSYLERWTRIQSKIVYGLKKKHERLSRRLLKEVPR